jgi:hypothetical protein
MRTHGLFLALLFIGISTQLLFATVRTVSNDPAKPAQYTSLQNAQDQAVAGDTILVLGSATTYGDLYLKKQLILIGNGYNRPTGETSIITNLWLGQDNVAGNPSGSKISGFYITGVYYAINRFQAIRMENTVIERCQIVGGVYIDNPDQYNQSDVYLNDTIRNCLFSSGGGVTYLQFWQADYQSFTIHNNIFENIYIQGVTGTTINMQNIKLKNNLFLNRSSNTFITTNFLVLENNIFFKAEPQGCTNCAFNYNITYGNANNTIPGTGNVGTGNQVAVNPQFVNFPLAGAPFAYTYDFSLKSTSTGKNAGTDGTDIGIMGGILPFEVGKNPPIPQMTELTIPATNTSVKQGGTLNMTFKATKQ